MVKLNASTSFTPTLDMLLAETRRLSRAIVRDDYDTARSIADIITGLALALQLTEILPAGRHLQQALGPVGSTPVVGYTAFVLELASVLNRAA